MDGRGGGGRKETERERDRNYDRDYLGSSVVLAEVCGGFLVCESAGSEVPKFQSIKVLKSSPELSSDILFACWVCDVHH